jgi:hypothetical protein
MPAAVPGEHAAKPSEPGRGDAISGHVLRALGRPGELYRVAVIPLWGDHFRVNVLVGDGAANVRVAHSFFLVADAAGNVVACSPDITRRY